MSYYLSRASGHLVVNDLSGTQKAIPIDKLDYYYTGDDCYIGNSGQLSTTRMGGDYTTFFVNGVTPTSAANWMSLMGALAASPSYDATAAALGEDGRVSLTQYITGDLTSIAANTTVANFMTGGSSYTYDITGKTYYAVSTAASTAFIQVETISAATYEAVTKYVQLNGTTPVALTGSLLRVNFAKNIDPVIPIGDVYISTLATPGVPTAGQARAKIVAGEEVSRNATYFIPITAKGLVKSAHLAGIHPGGGTESARVQLQRWDGLSGWQPVGPELLFDAQTDAQCHLDLSQQPILIGPANDIRAQVKTVSGTITSLHVSIGLSIYE